MIEFQYFVDRLRQSIKTTIYSSPRGQYRFYNSFENQIGTKTITE